MRRLRLLSVSAVVAGVVLGMGALALGNGGAQASTPDDIEALLANAVEAWNAGDAATFVSYFTDEGLEAQFGATPDDAVDVLTEQMEEAGPIATATVSDIFPNGPTATGTVDLQFEGGFSVFEEWEFVFEEGSWKIGANEPISQPIPPGVPAVELGLQEYAFVYNEAAINAADGNFAFDVTNTGEEEHEILLFEIITDAALGDVVDAIAESGEDEQPEGIGEPEFLGVFGPGQQGTAIPAAPLAAGRYGLICFISAPDGTPHAFLGMVSEFTVGSMAPAPTATPGGGGITPPSTGDGGLLDVETGTAAWMMFGLALTLALGGAAGVLRSR